MIPCADSQSNCAVLFTDVGQLQSSSDELHVSKLQSYLAQQPGERKPDTYSPTCSVVAEVRNTVEAVPSRYLFELDRDNHVGSTAGGIHGGRSCCSHLIPLIH